MKKDIHPEYREVLFHDTSVDEYYLVRSTLSTDQTKEYEGKTYPYCVLDISSASHPFYTGKQKLVDTGGRVDKFRKRFGNKTKLQQLKQLRMKHRLKSQKLRKLLKKRLLLKNQLLKKQKAKKPLLKNLLIRKIHQKTNK